MVEIENKKYGKTEMIVYQYDNEIFICQESNGKDLTIAVTREAFEQMIEVYEDAKKE